MEKKVPIIILCRPRGGEKLITQANDAANSIADSIRQLFVLNQNIFHGEVSYFIKHARNEKEFCYRYEITISADEVNYTKHALILTGLLNAISGIIREAISKLDNYEHVVSIDEHIKNIIHSLESEYEIEYNSFKYKKIMQNMANALKKASIHVEVQFLKYFSGIDVELVDFSKKNDHAYDNPSQKSQIPLFRPVSSSKVDEVEIIYKHDQEEKYIEDFDITYKAELDKTGKISINPYLMGKRIIIEADLRLNKRIVDEIDEHLSKKPLKIIMDFDKSPTNTYRAYDIIKSEDEIGQLVFRAFNRVI